MMIPIFLSMVVEFFSPVGHYYYGKTIISIKSGVNLCDTGKRIVLSIVFGVAILIADSCFVVLDLVPRVMATILYLGLPIWVLGAVITAYQLCLYFPNTEHNKNIVSSAVWCSVFLRAIYDWLLYYFILLGS
ncbi:MAG: hypothetical protein IKG47_10850 [Oscillospiraceae bacterium]|nr:hypothetical protein [Oscillospiraceae bacterium]